MMNDRLTTKRAAEILRRFRGRRFLVVGDLMLDRYVFGDVSRISPEAPVPVVRVEREEARLGGAANVANNLLALGADVSICGVIGDDPDGEALRRSLEDNGIGCDLLVTDPTRPTTRKIRIIAHQQQVVRVDHERDDSLCPDSEDVLARFVGQAAAAVDGVILSDYGKGAVTERIIRLAVERAEGNAGVFVDPKVKHFSLYRGVSLVTPNIAEAGHAAGEKVVDEDSLIRVGARLVEMLPGTALLVTRGAEGMNLFEPDGAVTHIPTVARQIYDVTGAGDTVIAAYAMAAASGATGVEAAIIANQAAGKVVQESGAATVSIRALEHAIGGS